MTLTTTISVSHTMPLGILVCNMVACAIKVSVEQTALWLNAQLIRTLWIANYAQSTLLGKEPAQLMEALEVTLSWQANGMQRLDLITTVLSLNTHVMAPHQVTLAQDVVSVITEMVCAVVSMDSLVPLVKKSHNCLRLLICIYLYHKVHLKP